MKKNTNQKTRINEAIRAKELRIIDDEQGNLGVLTREEAIKKAQEQGLDLIEVSPDAIPPVAKIMDYGKFQYDQKKKQKEIKAKAHTSEVKSIQIKIGTGENDMRLKAKRSDEWLAEGHRVKAELYLRGRSKYMEKEFLQERLKRVLDLIETPYKIVDDFKKSPKGIIVTIEKDTK